MDKIKNVTIVDWQRGSRGFMREPFIDLGFYCVLYDPQDSLPERTDLIFSFGFYLDFYQLLNKLECKPLQDRPYFFHWNTEGTPDLRFHRCLTKWGGIIRSAISREASRPNARHFTNILNKKAHRFRYMGDYLYAYRKGILHNLFDCSQIYVALEQSIGLPAAYIPWGTFRSDYATLNIDRDIDVLWMGKPRSKRRNNLVEFIRQELNRYGKNMVVIDGVEHPYVFGNERTKLFNRSKIALNLLPAWDAYNYIFKFHIAAGNRSLLISEPFLKHNPEYVENYHYVSVEIGNIVQTLIYYCEHEQERMWITENAYQLVTTTMTMTESIKKIMSTAFQ